MEKTGITEEQLFAKAEEEAKQVAAFSAAAQAMANTSASSANNQSPLSNSAAASNYHNDSSLSSSVPPEDHEQEEPHNPLPQDAEGDDGGGGAGMPMHVDIAILWSLLAVIALTIDGCPSFLVSLHAFVDAFLALNVLILKSGANGTSVFQPLDRGPIFRALKALLKSRKNQLEEDLEYGAKINKLFKECLQSYHITVSSYHLRGFLFFFGYLPVLGQCANQAMVQKNIDSSFHLTGYNAKLGVQGVMEYILKQARGYLILNELSEVDADLIIANMRKYAPEGTVMWNRDSDIHDRWYLEKNIPGQDRSGKRVTGRRTMNLMSQLQQDNKALLAQQEKKHNQESGAYQAAVDTFTAWKERVKLERKAQVTNKQHCLPTCNRPDSKKKDDNNKKIVIVKCGHSAAGCVRRGKFCFECVENDLTDAQKEAHGRGEEIKEYTCAACRSKPPDPVKPAPSTEIPQQSSKSVNFKRAADVILNMDQTGGSISQSENSTLIRVYGRSSKGFDLALKIRCGSGLEVILPMTFQLWVTISNLGFYAPLLIVKKFPASAEFKNPEKLPSDGIIRFSLPMVPGLGGKPMVIYFTTPYAKMVDVGKAYIKDILLPYLEELSKIAVMPAAVNISLPPVDPVADDMEDDEVCDNEIPLPSHEEHEAMVAEVDAMNEANPS